MNMKVVVGLLTELIEECFRHFTKLIKQGYAVESITMDHVNAWTRLSYISKCKYFKNCPFGHLCLIDSVWSMEVCGAIINLVDMGLAILRGDKRE